MDRKIWNNQLWILNLTYPKGTMMYFGLLLFFSTILLAIIFFYHYPVYQTFYGTIHENNDNSVTVFVPFEQIEDFQSAIENNKDMKLTKVNTEIQVVSGERVIQAEIIVSMSKKLLVENNIVVIRVKTKNMSIWKELSQKWKRGINNEQNRN